MLGKIEGRRRRHNRGWDSCMATLTQWTWVWVNCRSWWWTGKPGVLQSMGSQRVGHDSNWTELNFWLISLLISLHSKAWMILCLHFKTFQFHLIYFSHHFLSAFHWLSTGTLIPYSVQFGRSVVYDSLGPHGLYNARLPCPSPTPGAYSNSCPLSRCCHPTISFSDIPFSSHLQSFPSIRVFSNESVLRIR